MNAASVTASNAIDGAQSLSINTTGGTILGGVTGGVTPLSSLLIQASTISVANARAGSIAATATSGDATLNGAATAGDFIVTAATRATVTGSASANITATATDAGISGTAGIDLTAVGSNSASVDGTAGRSIRVNSPGTASVGANANTTAGLDLIVGDAGTPPVAVVLGRTEGIVAAARDISVSAPTGTVTANGTILAGTGTGAAPTALGRDVTIVAGSIAGAANLRAGDDIVLIASSGNASIGGALAGEAANGLPAATARTGAATLAGADNATSVELATVQDLSLGANPLGNSNVVVNARAGLISVSGAVNSGARTVLTSNDINLAAGASIAAAERVRLGSSNGAGVVIGDLATVTGTPYQLSAAELLRVTGPRADVDADVGLAATAAGRTVLIGTGTIAPSATQFGIRARGAIEVRGAFAMPTANGVPARTLTVGGFTESTTADGASADAASSIRVVTSQTPTLSGGSINAPGSLVRLRANQIIVGQQPNFVDALQANAAPLDIETVRTQFLTRPDSTFFTARPFYSQPSATTLSAGTLQLQAGQYALVQNTGFSTQQPGGATVGSLSLTRLGAADPLVGFFGTIAGQTGSLAAVTIQPGQLNGITPDNVRINGCVALQTTGCITSSTSIPIVNIVDPTRVLLVTNAPDLSLPIELVTGSTNEALWRDDEEEEEEDDDNAQGRPQTESKP